LARIQRFGVHDLLPSEREQLPREFGGALTRVPDLIEFELAVGRQPLHLAQQIDR
jgi:hypothetical protein